MSEAAITNRSATIEIPRGSLVSDVARGRRPVLLNTLFPSRFPPAAAAAADANVCAVQRCWLYVATRAEWLGQQLEEGE